MRYARSRDNTEDGGSVYSMAPTEEAMRDGGGDNAMATNGKQDETWRRRICRGVGARNSRCCSRRSGADAGDCGHLLKL